MYNETIMIITIFTLILAPTTTIVVALINTKMVNRKLLDAQTNFERSKKVADIYYDRRAELLLDFYEVLSLEYNDVLNLLHWLLKLQTEKFAREKEISETYLELINKNKLLCKLMFQSKIFLNEEAYFSVYEFVSLSQEYVSSIVDCFELYKNIDPLLLEKKDLEQQEHFTQFIQEVASQEIALKLQVWEKSGGDQLEEIKIYLKEVLKSSEIL